MAEQEAIDDGQRLRIPITKGKDFIDIDTRPIEEGGDLTPEVYREAMIQGLKVILNRGMAKVTKESFAGKDGKVDEEGMKAAAMKIAEKTFKDMRENAIRFTGGKVKKEISGEVMVEAMKLARGFVKQFIKDEGKKISHVDAKEITKAAKALLADSPELVEQAKATVAARKAAAAEGLGGKPIDVKKFAAMVPIDEKKKAKQEKEAAERKAASSATKAGKVAKRPPAKPKAEVHAAAH